MKRHAARSIGTGGGGGGETGRPHREEHFWPSPTTPPSRAALRSAAAAAAAADSEAAAVGACALRAGRGPLGGEGRRRGGGCGWGGAGRKGRGKGRRRRTLHRSPGARAADATDGLAAADIAELARVRAGEVSALLNSQSAAQIHAALARRAEWP